MRESKVEGKVCEAAEAAGWWALKLKVIGYAGFPDRMFIGPGGNIFFIEFKRPRKKPRPLQKFIHRKLRKLGFDVFVVDNIPEGKRVIETVSKRLSKQDGLLDHDD